MTVSYEQARAEVEARLESLNSYNAMLAKFDMPATDREISVSISALRALLSGPPEPSEEEVARVIYERVMDGPVVGEKPAWVPGGNSLKQDEARVHAQAVQQLFRSRGNG